MFISLIAASLFLLQSAEPAVIKETWEDGTPRLEYELVDIPGQGKVREGDFKRWHQNGELAEKGKYRVGKKEGRWSTYFEDGKLEATGVFREGVENGDWRYFYPGKKLKAEGELVNGRRTGYWGFLTPDGEADAINSGVYQTFGGFYPNGNLHAEGELLDGTPHGDWQYWWPSGDLQIQGSYLRGKKNGSWKFWHWDGTPDDIMIAGVYENGRRLGNLPQGAYEQGAVARSASASSDAIFAGQMPSPKVAKLFESIFVADPSEGQAAFHLLVDLGREAVPSLLMMLDNFAMGDPEGATKARTAHNALCGIYGGPIQRWVRNDLSEEAVRMNRKIIMRWISLWFLVKDDEFFWQVDLPSRGAVSQAFLLEPPLVIAAASTPPAIYESRFESHKRVGGHKAIRAGLNWLRDHQGIDGGWGSSTFVNRRAEDRLPDLVDTGKEYYDVGVTSLALLAFMAEGNTMTAGQDREVVKRGILWLIRKQSPKGIFDHRILPASQSHLGDDHNWGLYYCRDCSGYGTKSCKGCESVGRNKDGSSCRDCSGTLPPCDSCRGKFLVWRPVNPDSGEVGEITRPVVYSSRVRDLYNQALGTLALCEALATWEDPRLRIAAQNAVQVLLDAQNPYNAWGTSLQPDGANNTAITAWIGVALLAAQDAGVSVPNIAFLGADEWMKTMTDMGTGRTGSGFGDRGGPGGLPTRLEGTHDRFPSEKSEALTAMGYWYRVRAHELMAEARWEISREKNPKLKRPKLAKQLEDPLLNKQASLMLSKLPIWDDEGGSIDLVYWHFGSLAMNHRKPKFQKAWRRAVEKALIDNQLPKKVGTSLAGSWDPIGAWGSVGGRVYSTALATLTLQSAYRYKL